MELKDHIEMGVFDVFQVPYSLVEREHEALIHEAARAGAGIVIRGGVARGVIVKDASVIDDYPDFLEAGFRARRRLWRETEIERPSRRHDADGIHAALHDQQSRHDDDDRRHGE